MAGIRTCDRESQVQRPNHYTTEPPCDHRVFELGWEAPDTEWCVEKQWARCTAWPAMSGPCRADSFCSVPRWSALPHPRLKPVPNHATLASLLLEHDGLVLRMLTSAHRPPFQRKTPRTHQPCEHLSSSTQYSISIDISGHWVGNPIFLLLSLCTASLQATSSFEVIDASEMSSSLA